MKPWLLYVMLAERNEHRVIAASLESVMASRAVFTVDRNLKRVQMRSTTDEAARATRAEIATKDTASSLSAIPHRRRHPTSYTYSSSAIFILPRDIYRADDICNRPWVFHPLWDGAGTPMGDKMSYIAPEIDHYDRTAVPVVSYWEIMIVNINTEGLIDAGDVNNER